jgi:hypothetical protein
VILMASFSSHSFRKSIMTCRETIPDFGCCWRSVRCARGRVKACNKCPHAGEKHSNFLEMNGLITAKACLGLVVDG